MTEKTISEGRVASVNVGLPRTVEWKGRSVTTGIFKEPVKGRIPLSTLNLEGDGQADLTVHGGPDMAVYVYPAEHYGYWRAELGSDELPWGMFGENLSTQGLLEDSVNIGDRFRVGTAEVQVTQPRMPCYKLGLKFGRDDMVKKFHASRRMGFYFRVLRKGEVATDDAIKLVKTDENHVTIADVIRLYVRDDESPELVQRVVDLEPLPESWRGYFRSVHGK